MTAMRVQIQVGADINNAPLYSFLVAVMPRPGDLITLEDRSVVEVVAVRHTPFAQSIDAHLITKTTEEGS